VISPHVIFVGEPAEETRSPPFITREGILLLTGELPIDSYLRSDRPPPTKYNCPHNYHLLVVLGPGNTVGDLAPTPRVMPGCRAPIRSKVNNELGPQVFSNVV